jgi:MFS family permease
MDQHRRRAWFALGVLFAINMMNFYDRQIVGALNEPIRREWNLSDWDMGILNTAFTLIYAAVGVPLGRLSDRSSRTRVLSGGIALWSILTAATGAAWSYASMFALRVGVGVGEASCAPAANSLVGDLFPPKQRGRALSIMMLGLPIGAFLSSLFSGVIAEKLGWRTAFYLACVPGLLLGFLILFIPEPMRGGFEQGAAAAHRTAPLHRPGNPYLLVLKTPTMFWLIISGALLNFNMYAVMGFLQAFIQRYHKLPIARASVVTSIVIGAVGVIGLLGGGWAADRLQRVRSDGRLLVACVALLLSAPCIYMGFEQPAGEVGAFMVLTGAGVMLMYVYYAGVYAAIQDVIEPGLRGTAMALYFFAMYVFGGSFGSSVTGGLSDRFARRAMVEHGGDPLAKIIPEEYRAIGLHHAMYVVPVLCVVLAVVLFIASRTVRGDMQRLAAWYDQSSRDALRPSSGNPGEINRGETVPQPSV